MGLVELTAEESYMRPYYLSDLLFLCIDGLVFIKMKKYEYIIILEIMSNFLCLILERITAIETHVWIVKQTAGIQINDKIMN